MTLCQTVARQYIQNPGLKIPNVQCPLSKKPAQDYENFGTYRKGGMVTALNFLVGFRTKNHDIDMVAALLGLCKFLMSIHCDSEALRVAYPWPAVRTQ